MIDRADRVPTGVSGLDEVLGGGFPRGSLIVLAGNPGTGKTILSAVFIYNGAVDYGEKGIYVSFAENREAFFSNMLGLGLDFEKLEREDKFRFLDMVTAKVEAAPEILEMILNEVSRMGARRLVIDSFSAMAQAFKDPHEARVILHTILSRITRLMGCTTILIVEMPYGDNRIGLGIEEFIADGIILLRRSKLSGRDLRDLEVLKMRGTPTVETRLIFTLKDGFKVFPPFKPKPIDKPCRFEPQPDTEIFFSTGSPSLDEMLGGGYPRGSPVLIEIDEHVSTEQYHLLLSPTPWNFLAHGRGVIVIPSAGVDPGTVLKRAEEGGLTRDEINSLLRICIKGYPGFKPEPPFVAFDGESISEDYAKYLEVERELMEKTGQPVLRITGADILVDVYGAKEALSILRIDAIKIKETRGLGIVLLKPGYPRLAKILGSIADVRLRVTREHGAVLVYGIKPRTNLYVLEMDTYGGYAAPKLTPVI